MVNATIPSWAQKASDSFFKSGTIDGSSRAPMDPTVAKFLSDSTTQSFDAFVASDNDSNPTKGVLHTQNPPSTVTYEGNAKMGSYTQVAQADPTLEEVIQVVTGDDGMKIFEAAKDGNGAPTFLGQVLNSKNPDQGYLLSTAASSS